MHDSQFAYSRDPWTFGERKELERRGNGSLRLSRKPGLSTNAFAVNPASRAPRPAAKYGRINKEGFDCGYSAEPAREDADSRASGKRVANRGTESISGMPGRGFSVCTALKDPGGAGANGVPGRRAVRDHPENGDSRLPDGAFTAPGAGVRSSLPDIPPQARGRRAGGVLRASGDGRCRVRTGREGGLLVPVERKTRFSVIRYIGPASRRAVPGRLRELSAPGCPGKMGNVTTDNGCGFPCRRAIDRALKTGVHDTRACAPWEKGSGENAAGMTRRRYPRGTGLSRLRKKRIRELQDAVNPIAGPVSLKGMGACEAFQLAAAP